MQSIADEVIRAGLNTTLQYEEAPLVSYEQLCRVHEKKYIDFLTAFSPMQGLINLDADTVMSPGTLTAAFRAAGAVVKAVDLILSNQLKAAFCNVRPPGHHAEHSRAMGFCFFNNIAVGVMHALEQYHLQRVAIVDFDVHRGNGTEDIFQNNAKVLVCSIYEKFLYPFGLPETAASNIIPVLLASNSTGREFRAEIIQHALDKIRSFQPEMLFISAGFDGHAREAISSIYLTESDYLWISRQIKDLADEYSQGRIVSVLEGGYALDVLGKCVVAHLVGLIDSE